MTDTPTPTEPESLPTSRYSLNVWPAGTQYVGHVRSINADDVSDMIDSVFGDSLEDALAKASARIVAHARTGS